MAFLQKQKNLGDLYNLCEAQTNLGLKSMAYQSKNFVTINDGNIHVSSFGLKSDTVQSNYVLMATDSNGNAAWRQFTVADWLYKPPEEILLSSFSNDQKFVSETILEATVQQQITELSSTIIGDSISVSNMNITNFVFNPPIIDNGDGTTTNLVDFPCVLTNDTSNVKYSKLIQTYSNNSNVEDVCSSKAVYNLYKYVESIENMQIENTLNANNNLNELQNADLAVRNLGLNDKLNTSNLITHNITNTKTVTNQTVKVAEDEFVLRDVATGDFKYKPIQFSTSLNNPSPYIFVNTASISNLYNNNLLPSINTKLTTNNVLSEFFENQVLTDLFKERLYQIGIQEVAFSCNYEHLMNKPRDVGSLCNNMGYISSFSNLLELNKVHARSNLQISTVGHTGRFEDLILPLSMSNIFMDENLRNFPGIPFYVKDNFLNELSNSVGKYMARSNLGLGTMSTQNQSNVEILGGTALLEALDVGHEFSIKSSNSDIVLHSQSNDYHFLKCVDDMGKAEWAQIPFTTPKEDDSLCVRGLTFLTNNLHYNDSNYAISAWAISNVFNNNDRISNLVPIATKTKLGIVRVSSNYLNDPDTAINHLVFSVEGASNLYSNVSFTIETLSNDLTSTIETLSNDLTSTIETLSNDLTTTIETLSNDLTTTIETLSDDLTTTIETLSNNLTTTIETLSNEVYTEITDTQREINETLTPNINERIKTVTYSNVIVQGGSRTDTGYTFITTIVNDVDPENKTLNIEAVYPGESNKFLCGTGLFETVTKTTLRSYDSSTLEGDIVFTGNVVFYPKEDPQRVDFPETVLVGGDGIAVSGTTITNTGVVDIFDISTAAAITNTGLYKHNNTIINTGVVEVDVSSPGSYLEVISLPIVDGQTQKKLTMNFQFSDFQTDDYSFHSDPDRLGGQDYYGFVKQPDRVDQRNRDYLLTGDGTWKSIDAISSITLGNVGDVLYVKNRTTELTQSEIKGDITLSFSNADPGQVLTYGINDISGSKTYDYTWSYIHENAYRAARELYDTEQVNINIESEGSNYIYYADGQFRLPGQARDFSVSTFEFQGCNIHMVQTLDATIPTEQQTKILQVTHENIGGLSENYLEKQYIWNYQDPNFTIEILSAGFNLNFEGVKNNLLGTNNGETVLNTKALNKYIDLFRNDIILEDTSIAFDDDKCLSAMRTSNYLKLTYIQRIEKITEAIAGSLIGTPNNFNNDTDFKSKLITGYAMSNVLFNYICLNEDYVSFNNTLFYDPNITYDIRNQCITPYTLSNFAYKHLVAQKEKTTNDDNPHMSTNETKVITGGTLSNYVQEQITYGYDLSTINEINKFVRGSNLIKFNDDNRWASNDRVVSLNTDLSDNQRFITPLGTRQIKEIDLQSYADFDSSTYSHQIVTGHSLSNYVHGHIIYGYELSTISNRNKFVRGSNLIKFNDDNRWASNVTHGDLDDNVSFITPRGTRKIQEIDLQSTDNFDNSERSYQIVTGHSLSNYVHRHIIYGYELSTISNRNKFVRGSNLIKFNDDNRWSSNVTHGDLDDNLKFITPRGTRQIEEIDLQSTDNFDRESLHQIVTGHSLSNYVRNEIKFMDSDEYGTELNERELINRFEEGILHYNNYPTAQTIKKYLNAKVYMNYDENVQRTIHNGVTLISQYLINPSFTPPHSIDSEKNKILTISATSNLLFNEHGIIQNIDDSDIYDKAAGDTVYNDFLSLNTYSNNSYIDPKPNQVLNISGTFKLAEHICRKVLYDNKDVDEKLNDNPLGIYNQKDINYNNYSDYFGAAVNQYNMPNYNPIVTPTHLMHVIDDLLYEEMQDQNSNNNVTAYAAWIDEEELSKSSGHFKDYTTYLYTDTLRGMFLHETLRNDTKSFVTPKLLHEYVTNTIIYEREAGSRTTDNLNVRYNINVGTSTGSASIGTITTDVLQVFQQLFIYPNDVNRDEVSRTKKYMTIEDTGEVVFKQIEYLSGHTSNILREADEYSMVTGLMTQTSYSNQFVCGMYNHSNTVYVRNGYDTTNKTNSVFVVGTGTNTINGPNNLPAPHETANGLEVHTNGEVYVRSNLILGNNWRLSFTDDELRIEKLVGPDYIQKHVFN